MADATVQEGCLSHGSHHPVAGAVVESGFEEVLVPQRCRTGGWRTFQSIAVLIDNNNTTATFPDTFYGDVIVAAIFSDVTTHAGFSGGVYGADASDTNGPRAWWRRYKKC